MLLRNVSNHLPVHMALCHRRLAYTYIEHRYENLKFRNAFKSRRLSDDLARSLANVPIAMLYFYVTEE